MCFVINQWKQDYLEQELHLQGTHGQGRAEEEGGLKFTFFPGEGASIRWGLETKYLLIQGRRGVGESP